MRASGTRTGMWPRLRSLVAATPVLLVRRARRTAGLVTVFTLTIAFAAALAVAGPAYLADTIDAGARQAVAAAGASADLVIEAPVAEPFTTGESSVSPADVAALAEEARGRLLPALAATVDATTIAVSGPRLVIDSAGVRPALTDPDTRLRLSLAMLTPENTDVLDVVDGALPVDVSPDVPIQLAISEEAASITSLAVGSSMALPAIDPQTGLSAVLPATVVAIVDERRSEARRSPWRDVPEAFEPRVLVERQAASVGFTALVTPEAIDRATRSRGTTFAAVIRFSFDPDAFTADLLAQAAAESRRLTANSELLLSSFQYRLDATSGFSDAVAGFAAQARATLAELSIIVAGVVGAAAMVLLLVSRLIVNRLLDEVLLERARGASLAAIALRAAIESLILVAIALVATFGLFVAIGSRVPSTLAGSSDTVLPDDLAPLAIVVAVALLATPVQTVVAVRTRSTATVVRVNRRDVLRRTRSRRVARLAAEFAVLLAAAGALFALVDRGLLQTASAGVDPLIAAAPLLLAAAVTVLILRLMRWPLRAAARAVTRGRGVSGPVVASRLLRALAAVPLAALTIAIALVVGTGLVAQTVRDGQLDASWQRVGADARVQGIGTDAAQQVSAADGVTAASALRVETGLQLSLGTSETGISMLLVDRAYPDLVAALPDVPGLTDPASADRYALLAEEVADGAPLPLLVDAAIADQLIGNDVSVEIGDVEVPLEVVGTVDSGPVGYLDGRLAYVDLSGLSERLDSPLTADSLLVVGPGAAEAVEDLEPAASEVLTRAGWLAERRDLALVDGVLQGVGLGAAVLAVLALLAIVCSALAGSPERARYLALLRTIGVRPRFGVLLAVIDQVPLMLAALAGGLVAGLGIAVLLAPALGLRFLTGGVFSPEPSVPAGFLLQVVGAVVLVFAIGTLIEVLLRRRDRVGDAIRVGETV